MRRLALLAVPALAGCMPAPLAHGPDVLARGNDPAYRQLADGSVTASACLQPLPFGEFGLPGGCAVDTIFGAQVASPRDLIAPARPGPPLGAPAARAAIDYLYGTDAGDPAVVATGGGLATGENRVEMPGSGAPGPVEGDAGLTEPSDGLLP